MICSILVAASTNNAIGKEGKLLWHLPNDMKLFRNLTWGLPVIMGRKTYESIEKPLKGRFNIIITSQKRDEDGIKLANGLEEALTIARSTNCNEVFIIGGGEIYRQSLPLASRVYMTRVHADFEADTFFPVLDDQKWILSSSRDFEPDEKHLYGYSFQVWDKK